MATTRIPVKNVSPEIEAMIKTDGIYIASDTSKKNNFVAIMSSDGKLFMLTPTAQLDPMRILPTVMITGPFGPQITISQDAQE